MLIWKVLKSVWAQIDKNVNLLIILVCQEPFRFYRTLIRLAIVVEGFDWLKASVEEP